MKRAFYIPASLTVVILATGTHRDPHFWRTADRQGDLYFQHKEYIAAAKAYTDPWRIGMAQYRNGDFEAAAKTFARVPGATGAFNQGNAWLMHGNYDAAVTSYDRALGFHTHWNLAEDNKALALARKAKIEGSAKHREEEQAQAYEPDEIAFDQKGSDAKSKPLELADGQMSDADLRATWLRRVQTTPGDFLRTKFAYQAQQPKP